MSDDVQSWRDTESTMRQECGELEKRRADLRSEVSLFPDFTDEVWDDDIPKKIHPCLRQSVGNTLSSSLADSVHNALSAQLHDSAAPSLSFTPIMAVPRSLPGVSLPASLCPLLVLSTRHFPTISLISLPSHVSSPFHALRPPPRDSPTPFPIAPGTRLRGDGRFIEPRTNIDRPKSWRDGGYCR